MITWVSFSANNLVVSDLRHHDAPVTPRTGSHVDYLVVTGWTWHGRGLNGKALPLTTLLSAPTMSDGDIAPASLRPSISPSEQWLPGIISKSFNSVYFKPGMCVYWMGVQNCVAFGPRWPNFGLPVAKMTENGGFRPSLWKLFTQSSWNLVCTLISWFFWNDLILGHIGQSLDNCWPKNYWEWLCAPIICETSMCAYWVSVQNWFAFGSRRTNFGL